MNSGGRSLFPIAKCIGRRRGRTTRWHHYFKAMRYSSYGALSAEVRRPEKGTAFFAIGLFLQSKAYISRERRF